MVGSFPRMDEVVIRLTRYDMMHYGRKMHDCPVALAINRRLQPGYYSLVDKACIKICRGDRACVSFRTPDNIVRFIDRHSKGMRTALAPLSFTLYMDRSTRQRFFSR